MKEDCIIVTHFSEGQPGFLDFSYRIKSLAKAYNILIVSTKPLDQPELTVSPAEYRVLPRRLGAIGTARYFWQCSQLIRARRPKCVVLLHSRIAPLTWLICHTPVALYWNEHPSRYLLFDEDAPIKRLIRRLTYSYLFVGAARKASLVMPIGEAQRQDLIRKGCAPDRVKLVHMGVDRSFSSNTDVASDQGRNNLELIYIGSVMEVRGRDVMLEAVAKANAHGLIVRLTIVGAVPDQIKYCTDYARQLGIQDAVSIHGRIPGHEIPALLARADAGICIWDDLPWWRFNPPTKLFEYLVAGLPVLASKIATHTDYVTDWYNGIVFDYDATSLANAIRSLWERRCELPGIRYRARLSGEKYLWGNIEPAFLKAIGNIGQA